LLHVKKFENLLPLYHVAYTTYHIPDAMFLKASQVREGLVWLIGAVVCSLAAAAGQMSVSAGSG